MTCGGNLWPPERRADLRLHVGGALHPYVVEGADRTHGEGEHEHTRRHDEHLHFQHAIRVGIREGPHPEAVREALESEPAAEAMLSAP